MGTVNIADCPQVSQQRRPGPGEADSGSSKPGLLPLQDHQIWLNMTSANLCVGDARSTVLYKKAVDQFGTEYTAKWSVDNPSVLSIDPDVKEDGRPAVSFTALDYGNAVITCTVTWLDGTVRRCYCCLYVCPS